jgi:hypothetical protein
LAHLPKLIERLYQAFQPRDLGVWKLDYAQSKSVTTAEDKLPARFKHVLQLSHFKRGVVIAIEDPTSRSTGIKFEGSKSYVSSGGLSIATIPVSQKDAYNTLFATKFAALWQPRSVFSITNGHAFEVGDFTVRLGELRAAGSGSGVRSVIVSIQSPSEGTALGEKDCAAIKSMITALWTAFGVGSEGVKETWGFGSEESQIKAWCEILKLR